MSRDWDSFTGVLCDEPTERTGPYIEADRDPPDAVDLSAGYPNATPGPECFCGCGPQSTHHARRT